MAHVKLSNQMSHQFGMPPPFYTSCLQALKDHSHLLHQKPAQIYKSLVLEQAAPLQDIIKRGAKYQVQSYSGTFWILHKTQISPREREVTYRLIFGKNPNRSQGRDNSGQLKCPLCRVGVLDSEEHSFIHCETVKPALLMLENNPRSWTQQAVDTSRAVFLNTIP
jgi:hypothetical protein